MDQAALRIAQVIQNFHPAPGTAVAVVGKGNNGGDALVVLDHLQAAGWKIAIRMAHETADLTPLARKKFEKLDSPEVLTTLGKSDFSPGPLVLIDGLLGIGTRGDLREPLATLAEEINAFQSTGRAQVVAIDLPSGLSADSGTPGSPCVTADLTCVIGIPKLGLVSDDATNKVGRIAFIPLPGLTDDPVGDRLITPATLPVSRLVRSFDFHKGMAGRLGIVAGGEGTYGAAVLTCLGALHGGAGLITLYAHREDFAFLANLVPPEIMVKPVDGITELLEDRLDALVIGPGLGSEVDDDILTVLTDFDKPTVVDADGLNAIARNDAQNIFDSRHLITPHPGELSRLFPGATGTRSGIARHITASCPATLLYKGARTIIAAAGAPLAYNTTGTPGMSTGGSGDLLSGLCGAFLARGIPVDATASLAAWTAGRAAELALSHGGESIESVTPARSAQFIGRALNDLRYQSAV